MSAPHLLYVAWGFPPSRGAGMYRALATANAFVAAGWKVTVLTAEREAFERLTGTDDSAEAAVHPRIDVIRLPFDSSRAEPDLSRWSGLRARSPLGWNALHLLHDFRHFPEANYGHWRPRLVEAALRVHDASPVTLVIGTTNPYVDLMPGWELSRRYGVPYVVDFRDTWHLDVYNGRRRGHRWSASARWERRLLRGALETWFVNQPILDWHAAEHPRSADRFRVVANGFDRAFLPERAPVRSERPLTLGYLGTIYGPMPVRETFEGWRLARRQSSLVANARFEIAGRLGHYSEPDSELLALIESYRGDGVSYVGPVAKAEVGSTYAGFDALALILGKSRYVTSGKVFEYVATGLPVAALHDPETASSAVLAGYPLAHAVGDLRPDSIAETLITTLETASQVTPEVIAAAAAWAQRFERGRQLQPRVSELTKRFS